MKPKSLLVLLFVVTLRPLNSFATDTWRSDCSTLPAVARTRLLSIQGAPGYGYTGHWYSLAVVTQGTKNSQDRFGEMGLSNPVTASLKFFDIACSKDNKISAIEAPWARKLFSSSKTTVGIPKDFPSAQKLNSITYSWKVNADDVSQATQVTLTCTKQGVEVTSLFCGSPEYNVFHSVDENPAEKITVPPKKIESTGKPFDHSYSPANETSD